MELAMKEC